MLSLSKNRITKIPPGSFSNLPQLYILYLSRNKISNIQRDSFSYLPQLLELDLSSNRITNIQCGSFLNLPVLFTLNLTFNQITSIHPRSFFNLTRLSWLFLSSNQITVLQSGTFANLPSLEILHLDDNQISIIQGGIFSNLPKLKTLLLNDNKITVLSEYNELMLIATVNLENNPWQCDCRMVPFRQKMVGKAVEDQIICKEPSRFAGRKLEAINADNLICEEPQILGFEVLGGNGTLLEGETLFVKCDVLGIPTPDITVTLPSGKNASVESDGRVAVRANGTVIIQDITAAADSGLYVCLAVSPIGSTSAKLSIHVQGPSTTSAEESLNCSLNLNQGVEAPCLNRFEPHKMLN
ncbi:PREDICTED: leucine-rich repeat-containing protein 4C-like [Branchiostoma belcheri]|uniref:Leucine-rich repeat-containing protein 4C-like n=1 Tax=Branchiostoma belcheri TaxID=7741 RepID=A0A6P4Z984_BRABE|nr:PREDICTED: leucine-rich repeat-containing protein 4C-like [Branchiostoma belcheri]